MLDHEIIFGVLFLALCIFAVISAFSKKNRWISTEDFEQEKRKLRPYFSEEEFDAFFEFLKSYKGGYVRRRSGQIVYQDYLGKEKGDLKGIFFHLVIPNPNISSSKKEQFRYYLNAIGVDGVNERPHYETRDSKLKNNKKNGEEYLRKEVGNIGEQLVRDELKQLELHNYAVINGPVLKYNDVVKEFDHIVIGNNGVFCIETKAFGMTDGKASKASLFIDSGDKWILRKNKNNKELESPTRQILEEKKQLENIITSCLAEVHPILLLCNKELYLKNNIELPYDVIKIDSLTDFICNYRDIVSDNDKMFILDDIDKSRIN